MLEGLWSLRAGFRWHDAIDILIVAVILYQVLQLIRGTRAMQMLTGLGILGIAYFLSSSMELFTAHWILTSFFDYLFILVIVLFQDDFRRALTFVGRNPFFTQVSQEEEDELVEELISAAFQLAKLRKGSLIVLERETGLKNFMDTGSHIDANIRSEVIVALFQENSPVHDGALIVSRGRMASIGCFLPLTKEVNLDKTYGTRHRAAIGLTEETDAVVILVSEEARQVHLVEGGKIISNLDAQKLRELLRARIQFQRRRFRFSRRMLLWKTVK